MKRFLPFALILIVLAAAVASAYFFLRSRTHSNNGNNATPDPATQVQGADPPHVRGNPNAPVQFFREDSWSNAYEVVIQMIWDVLTRRRR